MIAIVDFGMGNLRSVAQAFARVAPEAAVVVTADPAQIDAADRIVLPGQGAMPDAMRSLAASGLQDAVLRAARSKPLLGVCIGEQMLFERSEEGDTAGLGLLRGRVVRFAETIDEQGLRRKIPHMGWNSVRQTRPRSQSNPQSNPQSSSQSNPHPLWAGIADGAWFYFVHSYYVVPDDPAVVAGQTDYCGSFTSAVAQDNIFATQFHPEKSAAAGLQLYANFVSWNP